MIDYGKFKFSLLGEKARACLKLMPDFNDDAIGLYQTMSEETWG